jgi:superfamily II DNA or RNA helicase
MKDFVIQLNDATLGAYEKRRRLIAEHYGIEQTVLAGGYGYRQILELVQNGADAILEAHEDGKPPANGNRIHVLIRGSRLYVANTGAPLSREGVDALLSSHSSPKRGNQIGRFGLGFKSLLKLGGKIEVFTNNSGGICFDPRRCQQVLMEKFGVSEAPALRLAWPVSGDDRTADTTLSQLSWAETVVRVEVNATDHLEHLRKEIQSFPAEFLLFFPVPVVLNLDDGKEPARELKVDDDNGETVLTVGVETSRWRVAKRDVKITDPRALGDATHIHARDAVPIAWAVPTETKREEVGRFWAFFPTHTATYLPGILNAPWKLNSDRNAIIGGEWNTALMNEAARLIADTLPTLRTNDDPARHLDAFPRKLERKDEDASPLVEAVWNVLELAAVIPDAQGTLRPAKHLWRHPTDTAELARLWQALATSDSLALTVHSSCLERQRASRLSALAERLSPNGAEPPPLPLLRKHEAGSWFGYVASKDSSKAMQVLKLAETYKNDCKPITWHPIRPLLAIIPTQDDKLLTAANVVFAPAGVSVPNRSIVASKLCDDAESKRILEDVMKVKPLDDSVWESVLRESLTIPSYPEEAFDAGWRAFWAKLRMAPEIVRQNFLSQNRSTIRVRHRDSTWSLFDRALLPGALVAPDDSTSNQNVLVDAAFHGEDGALLTYLGVCEFPRGTVGPGDYRWIVGESRELGDWLDDCRTIYKQTHQNSASWAYLEPVNLTMPKGWHFLPKLIGIPNAKLSNQFFDCLSRGEFVSRLNFGHCSVASYPEIEVSHPLARFVLKYGTVQVGDETVRLAAVVARRREPALAGLGHWEQLLPTLEKLAQSDASNLAKNSDISELWVVLIKTMATPAALAADSLVELWAGAARDGVVPTTLRTESGEIPLSQIFVTGSPDLARRARTPSRVVVTLDEGALTLWQNQGAQNLSELIKPAWTNAAGPAVLLVSAVPELLDVLLPEAVETARSQPVTELKLTIAETSEPVPCLMWENTLLLDLDQLAQQSRADRLRLLVNEVAAAGWLRCEPAQALQMLGDSRVDERRAVVAHGNSLAERLLLAVGEKGEPLRNALGDLAGMDFIQKCPLPQLAELTLAQLGPATLTTLKETLAAEGLKPPSRWNTVEARSFVASIGFPEEFAASPDTRRDPEEYISGPIELPPLHDFQEDVLGGIRNLVTSSTKRRRAVVSLPTGGGKTRVTVEAAVLLVLKSEGDSRSVLWVAQTDELCEQAVQAFRQVWLNLGAQKTDLRIVRLWGGNPNPAIQEPDKPLVVIASIQTLNSRMGTEGLAWLQKPGLVVVDECHHAITPSYTNLLRWLDAGAPRPGTPEADEPPILGLSATPFRTDDDESHRLAKRFDSRWLPADQAELHARLLSQGVLAKAIYEGMQSGVGLIAEEIERLAQLPEPWQGLDFERILEDINQRLAGNKQRNQRLVERIWQSGEKSILFFANSVHHAEEMSARLNLVGIPTAAISSDTPTVARRYFLDRFQRGDIRVLCNHSVLTTGFDAPKTDMVLIARQVFSPVRYMQIVGRGLRGEKNGGTAQCRIVTVVDNLDRFQNRHPYHFCAKYFSSQTA